MDLMDFGRSLLLMGAVFTAGTFVLALAAVLLRSRRLVQGARAGFYAIVLFVGGAILCLVQGFLTGRYDNEYIFDYSERLLPTFFKVAGLWGGLQGSLLFWTGLLAGFAAIVAFQHRRGSRSPDGRRLEPYVYLVLSIVLGFFVTISWNENAFAVMSAERMELLAQRFSIPLDDQGRLLDGHGLNPQLVNYWFVIHPPSLYIGFVAFTVPFAFAIASLISGDLGDYWVRIVRRWTMVAWLFLTSGIILGGLWAYRQLGWGGYWAWDPVENASFLPWLTGTAFLHSVMVQERREMLKGWNAFLIVLTFFLTIWGTWMTRSGVVQSVHAFAGGSVGLWFQGFMLLIVASGAFLIVFRWRELRGRHRFEALLSRESVFLLNNVVLVAIMFSILILSFWSKISHDFAAREETVLVAQYNQVMTPMFAMLLFLTALGPGLGWVKTSSRAIRRNFLMPALWTAGFLAVLYLWFGLTGRIGTWKEVLVPQWEMQHATAFYPTGLFLGLTFFICATLGAELWRSVRARARLRGEDPVTALLTIIVRNNRRWGGYAVHVGIAVLVVGIVGSSQFKVKKDLQLGLGESAPVGPYVITAVEEKSEEARPGAPYTRQEVLFRVTRPEDSGALPEAHGEARSSGAVSAAGELIAELRPELRVYPKQEQTIKEVSIERRILEDVYVYYAMQDQQGRYVLTVFINPLMVLIYLGWFIMLGGGIFAALPIPGSKVGLAG